MGVLDRLAEAWGKAVGTYQRVRYEARQGHRPGFFAAWAEQGKWEGGWRWGRERENQKRAIGNPWVFAAIGMIARECSAATFQVVEHHGPDDEPTQVHNHALEKLIRRPNPYMGRAFLWQYSIWWLKLDGNFYWFTMPSEEWPYQPREIWPLPAFAVRPVPGDGDRLIDYYEYDVGGRLYRIPAEYIVHVKQPNPFSIFTGMPELIAAMLAADADNAMAKWNAVFFGKQNTMPAAIINLSSGDPARPINPADSKQLKADLRDDYAAYERRTLVTTANSVSATLLGWNAKEMDFLSGRKFTKEEIFTVYGIHSGLTDPNATEANANTADKVTKEKTIWPLLNLIAEDLTVELVLPYYAWWQGAPDLEAAFEDIRPVNRELELREREAGRGVLLIDEIRQRYFQVDPLPDGRGQVLETEMQTTLGDFGVPDFSTADIIVPQSQVFDEAMSGELRKFQTKATRAIKRGQSADVPFDSDIIPDIVMGQLRIHLQAAKTADDVRAAFEEVAASAPFGTKLIRRPFRPWSTFENQIHEAVQSVLEAEAQRIADRIANQGAEALDDQWLWATHQRAIHDALVPQIEALALFGVQKVRQALGDQAVNINWSLANERAAAWARQYVGERSVTLTETTRKLAQQQVAQWIQASETTPDLVKRIGAIVRNPVRAEMIAITEATNTYAEANNQAWTEAGYARAVYRPAAHVRCRCYLQPYKLPDGTRVQVWYTARDERVCTQPLTVPWSEGPIEGCRALHTVVVSEGDYLGMKLADAIRKARANA